MEKKRILVVDDEVSFCMAVKLNLENTRQYEVKIETEGKEVLATARAFKPDLIFLDVMMQDVDGGEVSNRLKSESELKSVPIVFLTAIISHDEAASAGNIVGGYPFLAKPVTTERLLECIKKTLNK